MKDSTMNRATRRKQAVRRAKTVAVSGAAAAAMTVGLAAAPEAQALTVNTSWDPVYTAGALAGLLNWAGNAFPGTEVGGLYYSGPPQQVNVSINADIPVVGPSTINIDLLLKYLANNTSSLYGGAAGLYNTIANIPQPTCATDSNASNCRYAFMLGTSEATLNLVNAFRAQISSVTTGETPAGYIPFTAAPSSTSSKPTQTNEVLAFLQNPLRPNGGILSRFPQLAEAFGLDPIMPAAGKYTSTDGKIALNTSTIDATWAYDPIADFPAVFNPFSLANSALSFLPLNLLTGGLGDYVLADSAGNATTLTTLGLNLAAVLQLGPILPPLLPTLPMANGQGFYATLLGNDLPLTVPMRLPSLLVNTALKALNSPFLLGNPLADALQPALQILVNIGYTDVVTPTDGGTYNRSFLMSNVENPFGHSDPLTPEEWKKVPGDVWTALVNGIKAELAKPYWGIIVPNTAGSTATTPAATTPAPVSSAAVKAAAAVDATPVAAVQDSAPAAVAPQVSPVADSAPAAAPAVPAVVASSAPAPVAPAEVSAPANDPAPVSAPASRSTGARAGSASSDAPAAVSDAPAASTHRRSGASSSDNDSAPKSASTGRHRAAS